MPTLGYWEIRALGQPIRLLLNYVGQEFEDLRFYRGDGPEFSKEDWLSRKFSYGLQFPNLPFYIDGDVKITQSNAILMYLGRKYEMAGKTEAERILLDMLMNFATDLFNFIFKVTYSLKYEDEKAGLFADMTDNHLPLVEKHLADGNTWFVGDTITVVDFLMYEILDELRVLKSDILENFPKITDFQSRIEALPTIKKYMESEMFLKKPLFSKYAGYSILYP